MARNRTVQTEYDSAPEAPGAADITESFAELSAQRDALNQKLAALQVAEERAAVTSFTEAARLLGFSAPADLLAKHAVQYRATRVPGAPSGGKGSVAPKYKDPATGSLWTGRGRKPLWVAAVLAAGGDINSPEYAA